MIIDSHVHIFSPSVKKCRNGYTGDKNFSLLYGSPSAKIATSEELIGYMNGGGVARAVAMAFAWEDESIADEQNEYLADASRSYGGKIISFGSVPLNSKKSIHARVQRIRDLGLSGVGEIAFYADGFTPAGEEFLREALRAADDFSLPVCIHVNEPVGHHYPGKYEISFPKLCGIISDFQNVKIILSHLGGGIFLYELMPEIAKVFANVRYDTAATPFLFDEKIYPAALAALGPEKILFGSDYPLAGLKKYLIPLNRTIDDFSLREGILGKNAENFLCLNKFQ